MLAIYRGFCFLFYALRFVTVTAIIKLRLRGNHAECLWKLAEATHIYCGMTLRKFNFTVSTTGLEYLKPPYLAVCNHLSYLDIPVLATARPTQFVSHTGVRRSPLVGELAASAGTLFIDKSNPSSLTKDIAYLADMLRQGAGITIFPEGTTFDGSYVRPFHPALIQAAIDAEVPVVPIRIEYTTVNGTPLTKENKDLLYLYGSSPFLPHMFNVIRNVRSAAVKITVLPPIPTKVLSRKDLAAVAQQCVSVGFKTV